MLLNFQKPIIALCFALFSLTFTTTSTAQIEKTIARVFYEQADIVTLDLGENANVTVETWKDDNCTIRLEMTVQFGNKNVTNDVVKELITTGRYAIKAQFESKNLTITTPNVGRFLTLLNDKSLKESIRYTVRVPQNVIIIKNKPVKSTQNFAGI
jgi:hypothetical protein